MSSSHLLVAAVLISGCATTYYGGGAEPGGPRAYDGPTPSGLSPAPFTGCWAARYHDRIDGRPSDWTLVLDSMPAYSNRPGGGNGLPARRARASNQGSDDPYWRLIPGGIHLHVGDSLHGRRIELAVQGDSLIGRVFYYTDVSFPGQRPRVEAVSAHRADCPED